MLKQQIEIFRNKKIDLEDTIKTNNEKLKELREKYYSLEMEIDELEYLIRAQEEFIDHLQNRIDKLEMY